MADVRETINKLTANVAREHNNRIFEIDLASLAVGPRRGRGLLGLRFAYRTRAARIIVATCRDPECSLERIALQVGDG